MNIITPIIIVGVIGLLAGVILAIASIVMAVPKDEKAAALEGVLPGANCGACGYSGCSGYAAAMAKGDAQPGLCSPGGPAVAQACGEILGTGAVTMERKTALVRCWGNREHTGEKMIYDGLPSCAAALPLAGGPADCRYGCMGLGDCVAACEYGAVHVVDGMAKVDPLLCRACGKCVSACPKGLIKIIPVKTQAVVRCANCDKGKDVMAACKVGCIGCMKCVKTCPSDAIHVTNSLAQVDPASCTGCGQCVEACPRHIIDMLQIR